MKRQRVCPLCGSLHDNALKVFEHLDLAHSEEVCKKKYFGVNSASPIMKEIYAREEP